MPDEPQVVRPRLIDSVGLRIVGVLAIAVMLRPALAGVGPIIDDIHAGLDLPSTAVSLLTALPVLCFGFGSVLAPLFARWFGIDLSLGLVLAGLAIALLIRAVDGPGLLFSGTLVAGLAIAVMNVLLPRLVKQDFPSRAGLVTGIYTAMLGVAAATSALIAVPLKSWTGHGWRGSLFVWGIVGVIALVVWLPQLRARGRSGETGVTASSMPAPAPLARSLLRSRPAWALTGFMGLQSLSFYVCLAWLPSLLRDAGYSETVSGAYLSLLTALGIPMAFIIPVWASRSRDQRWFAIGLTAIVWVGFLGLLLAPGSGTVCWVILLGIGTGSTFPLTLLMMVLRSSTPIIAGQVSAMSQGFGYLICALGPFAVGVLHSAFDSWRPAMGLMLVLVAGQAVVGGFAGRAGLAA